MKHLTRILLLSCLLMTFFCMTVAYTKSDTDISYPVTGGNIYFDPAIGSGIDNGTNIQLNQGALSEKSAMYETSTDSVSLLSESISFPATGGSIYLHRDFDEGFVESCDEDVTEAKIPAKWWYAVWEIVTIGIGDAAFSQQSNLTRVVIPDSVQYIGEEAFEYCTSLSDITIPQNVSSIGYGAFSYCSSLTAINVDKENANYVTENGVLFNKAKTRLIAYPAGKNDASYAIPDSVVEIEKKAFYGCKNLRTIFIPDSVTSIGASAFYDCVNITDVYYTGSVRQWKISASQIDSNRIFFANLHFPNDSDSKENPYITENADAVESDNKYRNDYYDYGETVTSYLYQDADNLIRTEYVNGRLVVEKYDENFSFFSGANVYLDPDFPIWGGFYAGEDYNFVILGRHNYQERDDVEVIRVIKYDKNWTRIAHVGVFGANTQIPFKSSSLRCAESEGLLYIYTAHTMYHSFDGLNHQANMLLVLNQNEMRFADVYAGLTHPFYVSHSFNQFIIIDNDHNIVAYDHGDGYPRGAYLQGSGLKATTTVSFAGSAGDNTTGASLGGLTETSIGYITILSDDNLGSDSKNVRSVRNVYLTYTPKSSNTGTPKTYKLTSYKADGNYSVGTPMLVSTSANGGYALWNLREKTAGTAYSVNWDVSYVSYSVNGAVSEVKTMKGILSDCQPIVYHGKIVWYVTDKSKPYFYAIDVSDSGAKQPLIIKNSSFDGDSVRATAYSSVPTIVFCAFYNELGQALQIESMILDAGKEADVAFSLNVVMAAEAKLFALDYNYRPLCLATKIRCSY